MKKNKSSAGITKTKQMKLNDHKHQMKKSLSTSSITHKRSHIISNNPHNKKPDQKQKSNSVNQTNPINDKYKLQQQGIQDYIVINDCIYSANTFTERSNYQNFLSKVKRQKQVERNSFLVKQKQQLNNGTKKISILEKKSKIFNRLTPEDIVNGMSLQEKKQIFYRLQKNIQEHQNNNYSSNNIQIKNPYQNYNSKDKLPIYKICSSQPVEQQSQSNHSQNNFSQQHFVNSDQMQNSFFRNLSHKNSKQSEYLEEEQTAKFHQFQQKIQQLKLQIVSKSQSHVQNVHRLYQTQKLSQKDRQKKIIMIEKIKDYNIKLLEETRNLFAKVFKEEEYQKTHKEEKYNKLQSILQSLHSFPSLESLDGQSSNVNTYNNNNNNNYANNIAIKPNSNNNNNYTEKQLNISYLKIKLQVDTHKISHNKYSKQPIIQSEIIGDENQFLHYQAINNSPKNELSSLIYFKQNQTKSKINTDNMLIQDNRVNNKIKQDKDSKQNQIIHKLFLNQDSIQSIHKPQIQHEKQQQLNPTAKFSFKLDLRLEEVVLGQDHYEVEEIQIKKTYITENAYSIKQHVYCESQETAKNRTVSQNSNQKQKTPVTILHNQMPTLICEQNMVKISENIQNKQQYCSNVIEANQKSMPIKPAINIPLILTKDRLQNLEYQKNKVFRENLQNHIAFQLGCIQFQPQQNSPRPIHPHFTTLVDINTYIIGFYQYLMGHYLNTMSQNLNMSYGKSVLDKFYCLQTEGYISEECYNEMNNILTEKNFKEYQQHFVLTVRLSSEYEIIHNRAVFDAWTKFLNQYRPYYQLEGEVYPWIISEKGITFYEINEDNIIEVFEKSKFKVIEYCNFLCGVHPPSQIKNEDQKSLLGKRRQETLKKMLKSEISECYKDWNNPLVNFECLVRLLVAQTIYQEEIIYFVQQFQHLQLKSKEQM